MKIQHILLIAVCALLPLAGCKTVSSGDTPPTEEQILSSPTVVVMQSTLQFGAYLAVKKNPELRTTFVAVAEIIGSLAKDGRVSPAEVMSAVDSLLSGQSDDVRMGVNLVVNSTFAIYGGFVTENTLSNLQLRLVLGVLSEAVLAGVQPGATSLALPEA